MIIVSSINTSLYPIAKFLQNIISKSIPPAKSQIKNSFVFYKSLAGMTIDLSEMMVFLDYFSLYKHPLELATDSVIKKWNYNTT